MTKPKKTKTSSFKKEEAIKKIILPETHKWDSKLEEREKILAMLCHLLGIFTSFIAPLIIWLFEKKGSKFIDYNGKEALNFHISIIIYSIMCMILMVIRIGFILLPLVGVFALVMQILATVKTFDGDKFRYPLSLRLL